MDPGSAAHPGSEAADSLAAPRLFPKEGNPAQDRRGLRKRGKSVPGQDETRTEARLRHPRL